MGNPVLVPTNAATPNRLSDLAITGKKCIDFTVKERGSSSTTSKTKATRGSFIREAINNRELPQEIEEVIADSWQTSKRSRCESVLKRGKCYPFLWNENPYITNTDSVLKFLHGMYQDGCLYSGLCAARSALANVLSTKGFAKLSDHLLLVRYLKGIFSIHPPLPKCMHIWDINLVLTCYNSKDNNKELDFKYLLKKIVMLFLIIAARRKHALSTIYVDDIVFKDDKIILLPNKTLKHSKLTRPLQALIYNAYKENTKLYLVNCLFSYLERRKRLVNDDVEEIAISYGKPHQPVGSGKLRRWNQDELKLSGIDVKVFTAHNCRSASVSKAKANGMGINENMKRGCWNIESTFKNFYYKDIINDNN